jgi:hypothetical protein
MRSILDYSLSLLIVLCWVESLLPTVAYGSHVGYPTALAIVLLMRCSSVHLIGGLFTCTYLLLTTLDKLALGLVNVYCLLLTELFLPRRL